MTWTTALTDLRTELQDNADNKYALRKNVFGSPDGTLVEFATIEGRYVPASLVVYAAPPGGGTPSVVTVSDTTGWEQGIFRLQAAPQPRQLITASYYWQYFTDTEITNFLKTAASRVGITDYTTTPVDGLERVVLNYACAAAYRFLSSQWIRKISEKVLLKDSPVSENDTRSNLFLKQAQDYEKMGNDERIEYYKAQGRRYKPSFSTSQGNITPWTPRR